MGPASNDIGFVRKPDGTFGAVLSEYDRAIGFDEKWVGRVQQAHVIVRRVQIGPASNDIGFVRKPAGTFGAVLSEYDRAIGFDEKWVGRVQQAYRSEARR